MAAQPPPYSPRDAARAQQYYRRSLRRPSLVGPLVLISVGVIALLVETNKLSVFHLWDWYLRWWPLLLIGVGLLSLGEWWFDRQRSRTDWRLYRGSHGGMIALILCLALFGYLGGSTGYGFHGIHIFGRGSEDADFFAHLMGQEHDDDRNLNEPIPPGAQVEIQVPHGDVSITASGDDQIHVQAHLVVYAANNRAARRNLDALAPRLTVNGNSVILRASDRNDGRADLTIEIPKGAVASVSAGHGDVTLEGLASAANVFAGRGDVKADNLGGPLQVQMAKGDFSAHSIAGDLTIFTAEPMDTRPGPTIRRIAAECRTRMESPDDSKVQIRISAARVRGRMPEKYDRISREALSRIAALRRIAAIITVRSVEHKMAAEPGSRAIMDSRAWVRSGPRPHFMAAVVVAEAEGDKS